MKQKKIKKPLKNPSRFRLKVGAVVRLYEFPLPRIPTPPPNYTVRVSRTETEQSMDANGLLTELRCLVVRIGSCAYV